MMALIIAMHIIVCVLLIGIILIQSGRGGGLVDSFSGVESMFGTKTSAFLTKTTTTLAILFFITVLSLAVLSARQSKSLMINIKAQDATLPKDIPLKEKVAQPEPQQNPVEKSETLPVAP